ncbi:S1C family serine protease [Breznakiella homolactica]|uniref:Trypsin-like peptidase domain-containing protein n=1 Tax=Breznakiella homolactica TaxID=2798577 RepID=A0A7T8BC23_9SPIR|nr:trypsin-like peptidase domain-containing protein [Breznakiella homolactica]QQO11147.1 S1C family serine protease [Breznakiella homolactica]
MPKPSKKHVFLLFSFLAGPALLFFSCASAEQRLEAPWSIREFRLDDISMYAEEDPARAIHLIGMYENIYGPDSPHNEIDDDDAQHLENLREQAISNLKTAQAAAIEEKRWDDAASLARSLAVVGIAVESTGMEPDFVLAEALEYLDQGNNLAAFIHAVRAHELRPLDAENALLFLERAVDVKQRRTAAFFLAIIDSLQVPVEETLRSYAEGRDSPADMIKGVATVLVDRGVRIQRGMGSPDRVIGSAFFVDASGLLITNYHVIASEVDPSYEGFSRMYIRMGDSSSPRIPAKVIGWDKAMDLALIKAEITPEYVFSVVDRVIPRVGDTVIAIGSPGGLEKTVTSGIVSALGRRFLQIGDVIQIDAAVNHGNSGGPVVDNSGRLVGIVFAGIDQYQGLNFAVPAERLAAALPAMIKGGKSERPWIGLTVSETVSGAEIIYVAPYTPASEQQIPEGVYITRLNDTVITAPQGALIPALQDVLFPFRPGELVSLETSDGKRYIVMTAVRPDVPLAQAAKVDTKERMAAPLFGLILSPSLGKSFSPTYLVKKIVRGSIADEAGLSENDSVSIKNFRLEEDLGYALMVINVKKRRMGYMETTMQLPALLDSPDTL